MAESEEELMSLLMKVKEESEKVHLKLNIQKTKIMASSLITSWQTDGETLETVIDFIFLASKITVECLSLSHLFHLAECPQGSSVFLQMAEFSYFLMDELYSIVYTQTFPFFFFNHC